MSLTCTFLSLLNNDDTSLIVTNYEEYNALLFASPVHFPFIKKLNKILNVQVSGTTGDDSSTKAGNIKKAQFLAPFYNSVQLRVT